jgi:threonine dehydrogenase-like Zn-dependent dehydrogenase
VRAVVARGPGAFGVEDVDEPVVAQGGRLVHVEAAGVCAADRKLHSGDHPWGDLDWPLILGHELLGHDDATGERITCEVKVPCDACGYCRDGRNNLCPRGTHLGSGFPGAFAERLALPPGARVHRIPDRLPREAAVLAEPMACAVHAVRRAGVGPRDHVAVVGLGAIGALVVHAAKAAGAGEVSVALRNEAKVPLARRLGATTETGPARVVIECSGSAEGAARALELAEPGATVCLFGVYPQRVSLDVNRISEFGELTVVGGHLAPGAVPAAIELLSTVDHDAVVTATRPLADVGIAVAPAVSSTGGA